MTGTDPSSAIDIDDRTTAATTLPVLVALDIDGTILHHDGTLSPRVAEAIRALDSRPEVHVVIATGRSVVATLPVMEQVGLLTPGRPSVCSNGSVSIEVDPQTDGGFRLTEVVTFDPRHAVELVRRELPAAMIAVEEIGVGFKVSTPFPDEELWGEQTIVPLDELTAHPATRVTFRDPDSTSEVFTEMVERIGLHGVSYAVGYSAWLDLAPEGVSKASALELLRRELGVEPHRTVACGDQRNDLEMLRWAALGIAMGQAPEEVLAAADERTTTVEQDGLALALEDLLARLV